MGMYTQVRFKGKLKQKFVKAFRAGLNEPESLFEGAYNGITYWTKHAGVWYRCNQIEPHTEFEEMGLAHRSDEVFFDKWVLDGNNLLVFESEFKNYYQETAKFLSLLPIMFDEVYVYETLYDEDDDWKNLLKEKKQSGDDE